MTVLPTTSNSSPSISSSFESELNSHPQYINIINQYETFIKTNNETSKIIERIMPNLTGDTLKLYILLMMNIYSIIKILTHHHWS